MGSAFYVVGGRVGNSGGIGVGFDTGLPKCVGTAGWDIRVCPVVIPQTR